MSYDLYLLPSRPLSLADFEEYFRGRAHYSLNSRQAFYENEDTGVYFSFEYDDAAPEDPEDTTPRPHISFNMNYFRPHVFGLEAAPEVSACVTTFGCAVEDPQVDGIRGGYTEEAFLRGWNAGNFFGYRALLANDAQASLADSVVAESGLIRETWTWNRERAALSARLNARRDEIFVPRIFWAREKAANASVRLVVWGADIPTIIPAAISHVLVALEPERSIWERLKGAMSSSQSASADRLLIGWDELRDIAGKTPEQSALGFTRFDHGPERFGRSRLLAARSAGSAMIDSENPVEIVAWDHVLDEDLVEKAIARSAYP